MNGTERVLLDGLGLPESPRWHNGRIWFTDHFGRRLIAVDLEGQAEIIADFPDEPSGLGFLPDGSILVALRKSRQLIRLAGSDRTLYADLSRLSGDNLNDMILDGQGRAYVDFRVVPPIAAEVQPGEQPAELDCLVLVATDGSARLVADHLVTPNGIALTAEASTLIVGETRACRLTSFRVLSDGSLADRRLFAGVAPLMPDGIALDLEGAVWVAAPNTGEFVRVLNGGTITHCLSKGPSKSAMACALVGPDRRTLAMMTFAGGWEDLAAHRLGRGAIELARVEVPGAGVP